MRVYSLTEQDNDFLGIENHSVMLDLTKAISFFEIATTGYSTGPVLDIETLIWDNRFNLEYFGEILEFVEKHGFMSELTVKDTYTVNSPLYPGKIIALGYNYVKHIQEMNNKVPEKPVLFGKWPSTIIGQGEPIIKPAGIGMMSYEAELAFIVGKRAKDVPATDAMDYIAGFTCLNDITARDVQREDRSISLPWMPSKNYDTFSPLGPCVLLSGMVKAPVEIGVQSKVNGELRQNGNTRDFIFDIPTVFEYITKIMTLDPCDIVTTGTPEGVGSIEPGDTVTISCEGIGELSNPVNEPEH